MGPWPRARLPLAFILAAAMIVTPRPGAAAQPGENTSSPAHSSFLSRHRRPLLIAAGAGAAAAGIAAIAIRHEANDRYDEYQRTADPERIAALYDETERLDNRAAILFVTSEVLFVSALVLGFFVEPTPARAAAGADLAPGDSPPPGRGPHLTLAPQRLALAWRF